MPYTSESLAVRQHGPLPQILAAAALVALLDMLYPIILYTRVLAHVPMTRVPQSVASGLLGQAAFTGGTSTAVLGLFLHCTIALGWTVLYFVLLEQWGPLGRLATGTAGRVKAGLLYGLVVWLGMNLVVVPLSRANGAPIFSFASFLQLIWHPIGIGLPIALLVKRERGA
jgi:hypothetical protein